MSLESLRPEFVGHLLTFENFETNASSLLWSCPIMSVQDDAKSEDDLVEVNLLERRRSGAHLRRQGSTAHEESELLRSLGILSLYDKETSPRIGDYGKEDRGALSKCRRSHPYNSGRLTPPLSPSRSMKRRKGSLTLSPWTVNDRCRSTLSTLGRGDIYGCSPPPSPSCAHEYSPTIYRMRPQITV
ncbi:hypothetical protein L218DRAFT_990452 [Marasmius fiardii PR-910]|nr:hypothetical protein L218DRAFT_990452 [Marasmius fiardii PR-910]